MMTILNSDLHRAEDCVAAAKLRVDSLERKLQAGSEAASQECLNYWKSELSAAKSGSSQRRHHLDTRMILCS
ncbi:hypothetical protein D3C75_1052100 [compost metagenome]